MIWRMIYFEKWHKSLKDIFSKLMQLYCTAADQLRKQRILDTLPQNMYKVKINYLFILWNSWVHFLFLCSSIKKIPDFYKPQPYLKGIFSPFCVKELRSSSSYRQARGFSSIWQMSEKHFLLSSHYPTQLHPMTLSL